MKINKILFLILIAIQTINCSAQSPDKILDKTLSKIYQESNFPGFAVTVVKTDSTLFANSYGYADRIKKVPYTLETIQPIASVSKTFVALALMKAMELGYFTLETNINELLPFKVINPNFPNDIIKVRHLATHTSSLIDNQNICLNETYQLGNKPTIELGKFLKDYYSKEGKFYNSQNFDNKNIGTNYSYSNIATALMAYIIEYQSKIPFDEFTNKYIFLPLKMNNTEWFYNTKYDDKYATLYEVNEIENPLQEKVLNNDKSLKAYCSVTYPDGSLKTSANDLTLFLKTMMRGYFNTDTAIVGKQSYQILFAKQFNEQNMPTNMDKKEPNRGIFWSYSKKGSIRHTGDDLGVFSFISFNPITKVGVVMTLNARLDGGENHKTVGYFMKVIAALDSFEQAIK